MNLQLLLYGLPGCMLAGIAYCTCACCAQQHCIPATPLLVVYDLEPSATWSVVRGPNDALKSFFLQLCHGIQQVLVQHTCMLQDHYRQWHVLLYKRSRKFLNTQKPWKFGQRRVARAGLLGDG